MALFIDNTARLLIPSWREFGKSYAELSPIGLFKHPVKKGDIQDYLIEWRERKNLITSGELISSAIINGQTEVPEVLEAAQFVLAYPNKVPSALSSVSKELLSISESLDSAPVIQFPIYARIAKLKKLLSDYPTFAVLHIEIARLYMLLGQLDIAEYHVNVALYFDSNNRFVVRAAARFFIHINKGSLAIDVLRHSGLTKQDPWLMASEISVSRQFKKRSPNIKKAIQLIESRNFSSFDLTELCGTVGMEELENNGYKMSRKLFNQSLTAANDNSFAQAQWVSNNRNLELVFPDAPINSSFKEALCCERFFAGDYKSALQYAIEWQDEAPFSLKCVMFGSGISTIYEKDYKTSIRLLSNYLRTNQRNKAALNDLAYAYALNNDTSSAQKQIDLAIRCINPNSIENVDICIIATQGLILFRNGDVTTGADFYEKAIKASEYVSDKEMLHSAKLNYSRELLRSSSSDSDKEKVIRILQGIPDYPKGTPIFVLKNEVIKMLKS